jgi:hypothetical protein
MNGFSRGEPLEIHATRFTQLEERVNGRNFFIDSEISEDLERDCLFGKARLKPFQKFLPAWKISKPLPRLSPLNYENILN